MGSPGTVYYTMIARETEYYHGLHGWLTGDGYNALSYATHRKNGGLRRVNDGVEGIYPVHTQVADGKGAALDILRPQLACLCPRNQVLAEARNVMHTEFVCPVDYRHNQSLFDSDGQPDMYLVVQDD